MKNSLIETTTGAVANQMRLTHCGDFAGKFQNEAYEIIQAYYEYELNSWDANQWTDIMFDEITNKVYAVYAEDCMTCFNAVLYYVEIDEKQCIKAFEGMREKIIK